MPNTYFQFKQFRINQEQSGMKVTTEGCLFGAWAAQRIISKKVEPRRILDVGTGTGLLSLMLAQVTHRTTIEAIEINELAFQEASSNFSNSKWNNRLSCTHVKLQEYNDEPYDMIICNPPFFRKNQLGNISNKNQAIHNDDLSMEDLSLCIARLLAKNGVAYVIYPEWEMNAFVRWMEKQTIYMHGKLDVKNKLDGDVFRVIGRFKHGEKSMQTGQLIIRNKNGAYTDQFAKLVDPYYL